MDPNLFFLYTKQDKRAKRCEERRRVKVFSHLEEQNNRNRQYVDQMEKQMAKWKEKASVDSEKVQQMESKIAAMKRLQQRLRLGRCEPPPDYTLPKYQVKLKRYQKERMTYFDALRKEYKCKPKRNFISIELEESNDKKHNICLQSALEKYFCFDLSKGDIAKWLVPWHITVPKSRK